MQPTDSEPEGQDYAHKDIHSVDSHVSSHGTDTVLHAYEPAFESHQAKGCRSRPYANEEILGRQFTDFRTGVHHKKGQPDEYPLDRNQHQCTCQGYAKGARQDACAFLAVSTTVCLSRQSTCTYTKETEVPVQQVKQHGAYGDAANHHCRRRIKMSGDGDVHHTDEWHGDIGQNAGDGQFKYIFVDRFHAEPGKYSSGKYSSGKYLAIFSLLIQHAEI